MHPSIFAVTTIAVVAIRSLESGFHMITAIATIAEIELKSISAIVVAAIATTAGG